MYEVGEIKSIILDLKIEIRDNKTKIIATDIWNDWDYHTYWFEEGNGSCDGNRSNFFHDALKLKRIQKPECGDDAFSLRLSNNNSGEVLYNEFEGGKQWK